MFLGDSHQDNGLNTLPPRHLWRNIVPTAWIADQARHALGVPLRIISGYRGPQYNAAIGGASGSYHTKFNALDLDPLGGDPEDLFHLLDRWRSAGLFRGGLGLYRSFVHLDTRGKSATWGV